MSDDRVTFFVAGNPVPQPRPRVAVRGRHAMAYVPRDHAVHQWRRRVREEAKRQVTENPAVVRCESFEVFVSVLVRRPRTTKLRRPKPDVDNYAKAILDAMTGVVWEDDSQVVQLGVRKAWAARGEQPGAWITIARASDE